MNVSKTAKIELATEGRGKHNIARPQLENVLLDRENGTSQLVATNGHILAVVPVESVAGEEGLISPDALKAARKAALSKAPTVEITCNGNLSLPNGQSFPRPTADNSGRFPQWRQVVPKAPDRAFSVALDPALLATLAEAIGAKVVVLTFNLDHPLGPIRVTVNKGATDNADNYGVIMPCKL